MADDIDRSATATAALSRVMKERQRTLWRRCGVGICWTARTPARDCRGAIKRRQVCAIKRRIKLYAYCHSGFVL